MKVLSYPLEKKPYLLRKKEDFYDPGKSRFGAILEKGNVPLASPSLH